MSNRAAYNFLSSISLGGNQAQKKEPSQSSSSSSQPQINAPPEKYSHREHFKAKLTSTLEKKHAIIHRHDKQQPPPTSSTATYPSHATNTSSSSSTVTTNNKPSVHPSSLKRSTSNITISSDYNSHAVIRSTSGTSIPSREPSPRESRSGSNAQDTVKPRNNSVDQGQGNCQIE